MCHFWQTEPSSHPNWDNWVKYERKFKLPKKNPIKANNWHKSLVTFYTQASKEKWIFIHPSFLQAEQFYHGFPYSSTGKIAQDEIKDRHHQVISWTTTFSTRTCRSYIQDPKGLPSYTWSSPQETIVQTFEDNNNNNLLQIFPSFASVRDRAHSA